MEKSSLRLSGKVAVTPALCITAAIVSAWVATDLAVSHDHVSPRTCMERVFVVTSAINPMESAAERRSPGTVMFHAFRIELTRL